MTIYTEWIFLFKIMFVSNIEYSEAFHFIL